jgi:hypothetical protein
LEDELYSQVVHDKFDGRYKIISSYAEKAIDINFDGVSNQVLSFELFDLVNSEIIIKKSSYGKRSDLFFIYCWPEQSFPYYFDSTKIDPNYTMSFNLNVYCSEIIFNKDFTTFQCCKSETGSFDLSQRIESVTIDSNGIFEIVSNIKLYTPSGWEEVKINTRYKRYTRDSG